MLNYLSGLPREAHPFPKKEGERGSVVKDINPSSIERYGAPSFIGKGLGVRSDARAGMGEVPHASIEC